MSLQLAAQHIQKHGRNGDTMLVHMTPGEVKSLSDLAMAHGGHLTINPHTGLPEAGFLSSILPMVAGIGLSAMTGGAINPMTAGLLVGGVTGVASGSLSKGLMAGLGAYGGAGLGESLAAAGMQEAAQIPQSQMAVSEIAKSAPQGPFYEAANPTQLTPAGQAYVNSVQSASAPAANALTAAQKTYSSGSFMDNLGTMGQGVKTLGTGEGWRNLSDVAGGGMGLARYGIAAASPILAEASQTKPPEIKEDKDMGQRYVYEPGARQGPYTASPTGVEQQYFSPSYRKVSAAEAKNIFGFADGGQVPEPGTPTQYSYDPMKQMFNKIESIPSDDQTRQKTEQQKLGGAPQTPMTDAQFAAQKAQGEANAESLGNFASSLGEGVMSVLNQPPAVVQALMAITNALGIGSNGQGFAPGIGPASSAGEAAMSSTGSGNQAAKAAAISAGMGGRGGNVGTGNGGTSSGQGTGIGSLGGMGGGLAAGGLSHLGDYSDGGRLLRGPGDGVSDSIPAVIGKKQPARLADGEFVVPARIVSELGNGSTEAGARKLYAMMDRIQKARSSTVGKGKVAKNSRSERFLPA